ncbi:hypothetical protein [Stieleria sp.]|uniref:hypothetical protein n=1 Tax=Stieleria sp. TaxID=2795976 RepID=UPI0035677ADD
MQSYYTLMASLPQLPREFDDGPIPISAATLRHRVSMLDHHDRQTVQQVSDFFRWDRQPRDRSDAEIRATHRRLVAEIRHPLVALLVHHRFEMRMLVAALRCQRGGLPPPEFPELPLAVWIQRHWDEPCFRLNDRFRWLPRFCQAIEDHQPRRAQWHLFTELWNHWSRWNDQYTFSFESVVLYLARWEILHRWASQNEQCGRQRFNDLVDDILQTGGVNC